MADTAHLACTYAALILYDDGQDITGQKIATLLNAAGIKVESYWPKLFAKAVEGQNIASFFNFGQAASGPAPAQVAVKEAPKQQAKKEDKKAKKEVPPPKEQKEQQEDGGMGGLFD